MKKTPANPPDIDAGLDERSDLPEVAALRVVIVTGLSGSGKSTAIRALEDSGFFCIDNLPVPVLPKVLELAGSGTNRPSLPNVAIVVDTRERNFLDRADTIIEQLRDEGINIQILFLEANEDALVRRYSETRRLHPLSDGGTVRDGIKREREALAHLRNRADLTVDTTNHTVHTLKAFLQQHYTGEAGSKFTITVLSFGYKYGIPIECDLLFDLRFLPNPYFVEGLRDKTGQVDAVAEYVLGFPETGRFISLFQDMTEFMLPMYEREGKSYLTIGIGCTGGLHRSVAVSEAIVGRLRGRGWQVGIRHRDVHNI